MPFIEAIEEFNSVAIVGMEKNTGKTTCLNYVINRLHERGGRIALTSIGMDGEERDVLYDTPKPRIILREGMIFATSEKDFEQREFPAEVLSVSARATPLGRLITACAKGSGKVALSGPSDSAWLQEVIAAMRAHGAGIILIDGALSRMSPASPAVTDAMILCTGAACSSQLPELIRRTKFRCRLIDLPQAAPSCCNLLSPLDSGVWLLTNRNDSVHKIADTAFTVENGHPPVLSGEEPALYVSGAVTDRFLEILGGKVKLIVRDFSGLFVSARGFDRFIRKGGSMEVLRKAKLLAVCTNPVSPDGVSLNPLTLREKMREALQLPVYDIVQIMNHKKLQ